MEIFKEVREVLEAELNRLYATLRHFELQLPVARKSLAHDEQTFADIKNRIEILKKQLYA